MIYDVRDDQGNVCEKWIQLENWNEIAVGEWLFYTDDSYFGRVTDAEKGKITLCIKNFRVENASYQANVRCLSKVMRPKKWIFIDPDIEQKFPQLYKSLEKCFRIWRKIEPVVMNFPQEKREQVTPKIFTQMGNAFGYWMARGYMQQRQIDNLKQIDIVAQISKWKPLEYWANDEKIEESILNQIDALQNLQWNIVKQQLDNKNFDFREWLMVQTGFYCLK